MLKNQPASSLIEGLAKGSRIITGLDDFHRIMAEYPDNPSLIRLFADFLKKERYFARAIKRYRQASVLFMVEGEFLQAIAALFELWKIVKPVSREFRALYAQQRRQDAHKSVIGECFATMSYLEMRATLSCLTKVMVKADEIVQHAGDPEEALYFVVSGKLVKSSVASESNRDAGVRFLTANDHFGNDYPMAVKSPALYQVRAASIAELLKISKDDLLTLCQDHPGLDNGIKKLLGFQLRPAAAKPEKFFRKTSRHHLAISLRLDILDLDPDLEPIRVKGFASDLSLGGACVVIDPKYRDILVQDILHRKTRLLVSLPDEDISVAIMGSIAWFKEIDLQGQPTCSLGVQFVEAPPHLRASMLVFVSEVGALNKHYPDYHLSLE